MQARARVMQTRSMHAAAMLSRGESVTFEWPVPVGVEVGSAEWRVYAALDRLDPDELRTFGSMLWMLGEAGVLWRTREPPDATLVEPVSPPALRQLARLAIRECFWTLDDEQRADEAEEQQRRQSLKDRAAIQAQEKRRASGAAEIRNDAAIIESSDARSATASSLNGGGCVGDGSPAAAVTAAVAATSQADAGGHSLRHEAEAVVSAPRWGLTFDEFVAALPLPPVLKRFLAIDAFDLLQLD